MFVLRNRKRKDRQGDRPEGTSGLEDGRAFAFRRVLCVEGEGRTDSLGSYRRLGNLHVRGVFLGLVLWPAGDVAGGPYLGRSAGPIAQLLPGESHSGPALRPGGPSGTGGDLQPTAFLGRDVCRVFERRPQAKTKRLPHASGGGRHAVFDVGVFAALSRHPIHRERCRRRLGSRNLRGRNYHGDQGDREQEPGPGDGIRRHRIDPVGLVCESGRFRGPGHALCQPRGPAEHRSGGIQLFGGPRDFWSLPGLAGGGRCETTGHGPRFGTGKVCQVRPVFWHGGLPGDSLGASGGGGRRRRQLMGNAHDTIPWFGYNLFPQSLLER
mmetsp:Transcript_16930/g.34842  ORF Transcript_16930/g.34842 Transcript_16930/m.34842 type:complete len:324 (+) Transcript_16930:313-1284(+)